MLNSAIVDRFQPSYTEIQVVLKNGCKHPVQIYPDSNGKARVFVGDKDGNLLIEKIILSNGSEILVKPDKNGLFLLKTDQFEIEIYDKAIFD